MSKMKKVLSMALVVTLTAGIAISGTMAYLTSQDSDVNVMTLGNVKIAQHEYQRVTSVDGKYVTGEIGGQNSYMLEAFEQGKALLPIVGDPSSPDGYQYAGWDNTTVRMSQVGSYGGMQVFAGKNAQDKFVTVENTGKTDAYVRTLVAIEIGSTDGSLIGNSYHKTWKSTDFDTTTSKVTDPLYITIDDNNYMLYEYIYAGARLDDGSWRHENGVLPAGDTSYPNLSQVYLKSEATNEDVEAIDGNCNGMLDILVFSQAVQAAGFESAEKALDAAFGDITQNNHPWIDGEAKFEAPEMVNNEISLDADYYLWDQSFFTSYDATEPYSINGNGHTVNLVATEIVDWGEKGNMPENGTVFATANGATVTVSDITFTGSSQAIMAGYYRTSTGSSNYNTVFNNVNFEDIEATGSGAYICSALMTYGTTILNNCNITGTTISALYADEEDELSLYDLAVVNYTDTTINGGKIGSIYAWPQATITVNGAEIDTMYIGAFNKGSVTIKSGSTVGSIIANYFYDSSSKNVQLTIESGATVDILDLSIVTDASKCNITVQDGANVGKIIANGNEYDSIDDWMNAN